MRFTVATYNIHKGFSHLNRRMVIHELRERLHGSPPTSCSCRKCRACTAGTRRATSTGRCKPQHEFIADTMWHEVAYGKNAIYRHGHHGNAVLSRYPDRRAGERGHLRARVRKPRPAPLRDQPRAERTPMLHCLNVHLGLFERGRQWQIRALCERINATRARATRRWSSPATSTTGGTRRNRALVDELGVVRGVRGGEGAPGAHVSRRCMPVFRLDRIYARGLDVVDARVHYAFPSATDLRSRGARRHVRAASEARVAAAAMNRFTPGNAIELVAERRRVLPGADRGDRRRAARGLARDLHLRRRRRPARVVADALVRAAQRGVVVRVLVDGWGARHYLTRALERALREGGVQPPEVPARGRAVAVPLAPAAPPAPQALPRRRRRSPSSAASTSSTT